MSVTLQYKGRVEFPYLKQGYYVIDGSNINQVFNALGNNQYADLTIEYVDESLRACKYIIIRFENTNNNRIKLYNGVVSDKTLIKTMPYVANYDLTFGIGFHDFWKKYEAFIQYGDNRTQMFISQNAYLSSAYYYGKPATMPSLTLTPQSFPPQATSTTTHDVSFEKIDYSTALYDTTSMMSNLMDLMTQMMNMMLIVMVMTMPIRMMSDIAEAVSVE